MFRLIVGGKPFATGIDTKEAAHEEARRYLWLFARRGCVVAWRCGEWAIQLPVRPAMKWYCGGRLHSRAHQVIYLSIGEGQ